MTQIQSSNPFSSDSAEKTSHHMYNRKFYTLAAYLNHTSLMVQLLGPSHAVPPPRRCCRDFRGSGGVRALSNHGKRVTPRFSWISYSKFETLGHLILRPMRITLDVSWINAQEERDTFQNILCGNSNDLRVPKIRFFLQTLSAHFKQTIPRPLTSPPWEQPTLGFPDSL